MTTNTLRWKVSSADMPVQRALRDAYEAGGSAAANRRAGEVKTADDVGRTIIDQMGGAGRLRAMLGARITLIPRGVQILWPNKQRTRGNMVEIVLQPSDTYDMTFYNATALARKPIKKYNDIYAEQLVELFEGQTGLYLRLASGGNMDSALRWKTAADDRWKYNFIGGQDKVTLMVSVTASEAGGWRAEVGISEQGKVIEKSAIKSEWSKSFEGAVNIAKGMARRYKIKWSPKHYSTEKDHKPGSPPPVEELV